jgi:hypothetical protein
VKDMKANRKISIIFTIAKIGNLCVLSWCDEQKGCMHSTVTCDDGDPCTDDYCDPNIGCVFAPKNCSTGDCCMLEGCYEGSYISETYLFFQFIFFDHLHIILGECWSVPKCEDMNPCTIEVCSKECSFGTCTYALEDCCYLSYGQTMEINPDVPPPRPLGNPLLLDGSQNCPPSQTTAVASAYFWLRACDGELIYDITIDEDSLPPGTQEEVRNHL